LIEKLKVESKKSKIWDEDYKEKRKLKEHILENEQNYLCAYCEAKVTLDDSHIEHIKPKSLDYDLLTFDYKNLIVSCNGTCFSEDKRSLTCGHKKGNDFDEILFLNPTKIKNIRDYFIYTNNFYIAPSKLDKSKAKYTMDLLELNSFNNYLPEARKKALDEFRVSVRKYVKSTGKDIKTVAKRLLEKENLAFISFLRFFYRKVL
jgi:uncharacterized protein (TIGR02646 family)